MALSLRTHEIWTSLAGLRIEDCNKLAVLLILSIPERRLFSFLPHCALSWPTKPWRWTFTARVVRRLRRLLPSIYGLRRLSKLLLVNHFHRFPSHRGSLLPASDMGEDKRVDEVANDGRCPHENGNGRH
jgi:hypothetical protein